MLDQKIPESLNDNNACIVGLVADPESLADIRRNRVAIMNDHNLKEYTNLDSIKKEVNASKNILGLANSLNPESSGQFFDWDRKTVPW